ncbi:MAG: 4Fe-4S binding protein [Firmicutes bacterium]|nr:4Fe-4S binding protein [Bacillota bacterium]
MDYRLLGRTGLTVSRLCFGTLTMGPLQSNLPLAEGAALLEEAYDYGINFWDTAEHYRNYDYLRLALKKLQTLPVIATKSYAYDREGARASLEKARREMDIDIVPLFLLHEQESALTLKGHQEALDFFLEAKAKGLIKAVGLSTHTIAAVRAAADWEGIDVLHAIVNYRGIGIKDGTIEEMLAALARAYQNGLGIYGMKALGGGHLIATAEKAFDFVLNRPELHSFAVGISSPEELLVNLHYLRGTKPPPETAQRLARKKRRLEIEEWCIGCGACVENCPQGALHLEEAEPPRAVVDASRCILCGYCGAYCPEFCIKIF